MTPNLELVEYIQNAERILIFTGAGVSTASGIPDFRGPDGVWKTRRPVYYRDFMTSEEARIEAWDQKLEGWAAFENARPNAVHKAVVKLERIRQSRMRHHAKYRWPAYPGWHLS